MGKMTLLRKKKNRYLRSEERLGPMCRADEITGYYNYEKYIIKPFNVILITSRRGLSTSYILCRYAANNITLILHIICI